MKQKIFQLTISLFLTSTLLFIAEPSTAQLKKFSIGPYVEFAWTQGDFAFTNSNGIGAGIAGDIRLGKKLNLTGSAGYMRFGKIAGETTSEVLTAVPIKLGLKYKLPIVYLKLESGTAKMNQDNGTGLILSPGIGFRILGLDVQGSYESWLAETGRSFAALRIAYHF